MSRLRQSLRKAPGGAIGRAAVELFLIVAGILLALGIDGWVQAREDRASEAVYLELLVRDLDATIAEFDRYIAFTRAQTAQASEAYRALQAPVESLDPEGTAALVAPLVGRQTVRLIQPTYTDLLSTGNLRLIRNRALRDDLVRFHEAAQLRFDILAKNTTVLADDLWFRFVSEKGLLRVRPIPWDPEGRQAFEAVEREFGPGFQHAPDLLFTLPPDAPEWSQVRTSVYFTRVLGGAGLVVAVEGREEAVAVRDALEAELARAR
ncbi:MAG: hypothetical protein PVI57_14345 [Gemmatimonadota bacterium]